MNELINYLSNIPQFLTMINVIIMAYLPVHNATTKSFKKLAILWCPILAITIFASAALKYVTGINFLFIIFPLFLLYFLIYQRTIQISFAKGVCLYLNSLSIHSCLLLLSYAFDCNLFPLGSYDMYSLQAALFLLLISSLTNILTGYFFYHFGSILIKSQLPNRAWSSLTVLYIFFMLIAYMTIPHNYETTHFGRIMSIMVILYICTFFLLLYIDVLFYMIASSIMDQAALKERLQLLQVQADRYQSLQYHMEQTRKLRHDFKHSVHALSILASNNDIDDVKKHLSLYEQELDANSVVFYCHNYALNALFQYYNEMATNSNIITNWKIDIPNPLTISELDLFSLIGNLLENAILGCNTVISEKRFFSLTITVIENQLYIVSSNSFNGVVKKEKDHYLTTRKNGSGIGLSSIQNIVEKYHGSMDITVNKSKINENEIECENEFDIDIALSI